MKIRTNTEFPCGLKMEVFIDSGIFGDFVFDINERDKICPIHGKNCKRSFK